MLILQILPGSYPRVTRYCPRLSGCSAFAGAVDFPFLVRNAKFTGSGPAVLRHAVLLNWPVFWLSENVSMVSAAHHCHAAVTEHHETHLSTVLCRGRNLRLRRTRIIAAEGASADKAHQPGVLVQQPGRQLRVFPAQAGQVGPHVRDYARHLGHHGLGIAGAFQVAIGAVDDLGPDQLVREVLGAAEARLEEVAPAAAHSAQPGPGPVAGEDRLPLAGDELFPAEALHLFRIVVIHRPNSKGCRARRAPARWAGRRRRWPSLEPGRV